MRLGPAWIALLLVLAALGIAYAKLATDAYAQGSDIPRIGHNPPVETAQVQRAAPTVDNFTECLAPSALEDGDGDVSRNLAALSGADLCIKQHIFDEGHLRWVLQIIQSKLNPKAIFWFVPHDNENDGFDSAVYGVRKFGGTVIAVETGGNRLNGPQDPNRNFDTSGSRKCPNQTARSPIYTKNVMRWRLPDTPIVALHTNAGLAGISISKPLPGPIPFPSATPIPAKSQDNTLIFVASTARPEMDGKLMQYVGKLNQNGIHVLYEVVSAHQNDCSLSNYAALAGIREYINIEVLQSDGATQRHMIDTALALLLKHATGPAGRQ